MLKFGAGLIAACVSAVPGAPAAADEGRSCQTPAAALDWTSPSSGPLTTRFGWHVHPLLGVQQPHLGWDYDAAQGSPVVTAAPGIVYAAGRRSGDGLSVIVDHAQGFRTVYSHLSMISVQVGACLRAGSIIGTVGSTGLSDRPHLHFEIWRADLPLNPAVFFQATK